MILSESLKEATNESHIQIGKTEAFSQLLSPSLTKEEYTNIITGWFHFITKLEKEYLKLPGIHNIIPDLDERLKTSLLQKEIQELKINNTSPTIDSTTPECTNINQFLGILYVLEGSTLGAQFITKQLKTNQNLSELSFHFYNGYAKFTTEKWETFKNSLNTYGQQHINSHQEIIASANACFVCLSNSINRSTK